MAFLLWGVLAIPSADAQKTSSQLKKDKQKIEKEIANTQSLIKKNEKNQKASLQQIAVLRQQISNREKLITTLNQEIIRMEEEQEQNQQEILNLQKKLDYMKADYAQVVYMAYRNRKLMDKVTFILAADDFSQMFRRIRFYTIFSENVRTQADKSAQTQAELKEKNEQIIAMKQEKLNLLSGKESEIKKLESDRRAKTRSSEQLKKQSTELKAQLEEKQQNIGHVLENIVYLELLRQDYKVTIGKINGSEIDFVCRKDNRKIYVQVCYLLNDDVIEREFKPLSDVRDNYPKYVLSLDFLIQSRNGIIHWNIVDLMSKNGRL